MTTDVAVVTALPIELNAFLKHSGPWARVESTRGSIRTYYKYTTEHGLSVIAVTASGMGQLNAALVARDIMAEWGPKKLLLVGIAAGISDEVHLGDIVVSDQIVDYELGKITPSGATPRWSVYRSDALLREQLMNFDPTAWISQVTARRPSGDDTAVPKAHCGVVLSGNKVIADEETAGALRSVWSRAVAVEMEAAGIAAALYQTIDAPSFVMIKGISDRADSLKDDKWQAYAADVAGAFTMSFILKALMPTDVTPSLREKEPEIAVTGLDFRALRLTLSAAFDLRELKILASDLQVDWDNIAGQLKDEKIVDFIGHMKRRNRLNQLIDIVKQERPGLLEAYLPQKEAVHNLDKFASSSAHLAGETSERSYMEMAIQVAKQSIAEDDAVHPKVGAVVVKDGRVVGTAFRGETGPGDHAEFEVLEKKLKYETLAGATVYTTLEPCTTRKHPKEPCAQRLMSRKVKRVVIGMLDPNPKIRGMGQLLLRDASIETGLFDPDLMAQVEELNRDFIKIHRVQTIRREEDTIDFPTGMRVTEHSTRELEPPDSQIWKEAASIYPDLNNIRNTVYNKAIKKCDLVRDPSLDKQRIARDIYDVEALIALAKVAPNLSSEQRKQLLKFTIRWIEDPSTTWTLKHRSLILAATLAVLEPGFAWHHHSRVGKWLREGVKLSHGDHWFIALAILSGEESLAHKLSKKGVRLVSKRERTHTDLVENEHATLNILQGLRSYIVAAKVIDQLSVVRSERIAGCLSWVDFDYFSGLRKEGSHHQLRLLIDYADLLTIGKICKRVIPDVALNKRLSQLASDALSSIENKAIAQAALRLQKAVKHTPDPWHIEVACLHQVETWIEGEKMSMLRDALIGFYRVMVEERGQFGGYGWTSWIDTLNAFGLTSGVKSIQDIAVSARGKKSPPISV